MLDRLVYHTDALSLPAEQPHAFVYFLTIHNESDHTVTLLGRKWIVEQPNGERLVIEGDKIVGQEPRLAPGEAFSYNSYHLTAGPARAYGSFHGLDETGQKVFVRIPAFAMTVPATS